MKTAFYKKLQDDFVMIRMLYYTNSYNRNEYNEAILSITEARKKISMHSVPDEKMILLYCIDTLFEILAEGDRRKIYDFADTIHNVPEVYMQTRNIYSLSRGFKVFRRRYGKTYFPFVDEVKPRFTPKAPKNKWEYFDPASDEEFKALHPVGYKCLCAVAGTVLLLPMWIFIICCIFINPAPNEWPLLLGVVGTFVIGIGFFNIVAAWINQYLGHLLTFGCIFGGAGLTTLAVCLLYT